MKRILVLLPVLAPALLITACNQQSSPGRVAAVPATPPSEAAPAAGAVAVGSVIETMNTAGYTYIQVDTGSEKIWAAAPQCAVQVGDQVVVPEGMPMRNYHSKTLDRDFDLVYFVNTFHSPAGNSLSVGHGMAGGHPLLNEDSAESEIDLSGLQKAEGGKTIAELHAEKSELSGKQVIVRGKVTKFSPQIMDRNWLHVRDGTGDAVAGTDDLTVTTKVAVQVGDTVLVTGELHLDKDLGYGYQYDVIIEDAQIVVE